MAQVKRGRPTGRKNLKRTSRGSIILPSGERITLKEQKALKSAVVLANRKRKRTIEKLSKQALRKYQDFGVESDFVARKKSASFGRFRNKKEFESYLKSLQKINSPEYFENVVGTYRVNLNRAIGHVFGSSGDEIREYLNTLNDEEFWELSLNESFEDIGFVYYEPVATCEKLRKLKYQVGAIRKRRGT